MKKIMMYTTRWCPFCVMAKRLLAAKGVTYEEIAVDGNDALRHEIMSKTGRRTVPQIFIGDRHVGGFEDIAALDRQGQLDPLLADAPKAAK